MSKIKTIKKKMVDDNLQDMFNQMVGGDGDANIVYDKYCKLRDNSKLVVKMMTDFANSNFFSTHEYYKAWCDEIKEFVADTQKFVDRFEEFTDEDDHPKEFCKLYKELKDDNHCKRMILVCREIMPYKKHILEMSKKYKWITDHPGTTFVPFEFTQLDLKFIFLNEDTSDREKQYIIIFMSVLFKKCYQIYKMTSTADVDVTKFSGVITAAIEKLKKIPELNRCTKAFKKITESTNLFEGNFDDYYADMVSSKNPSSMIENFIIDVSKDANFDASMMMQFKKIIAFYRKQQNSSKAKNDPRLNKLFSDLNDKMSILETGYSKARAKTET